LAAIEGMGLDGMADTETVGDGTVGIHEIVGIMVREL
jgi:hypothetical protein